MLGYVSIILGLCPIAHQYIYCDRGVHLYLLSAEWLAYTVLHSGSFIRHETFCLRHSVYNTTCVTQIHTNKYTPQPRETDFPDRHDYINSSENYMGINKAKFAGMLLFQ